jgi:hypothetical protein
MYEYVLSTAEVCYGLKKFVTREIMNVDEAETTAQTKPSNVVAVSCSDLHVCRRKFHPAVYYCPSAKMKAEMTYVAPIGTVFS